jgi:acetate kinase
MTMDAILVVNAGSSSVKFEVYAVELSGALSPQLKGQVDGIGRRPRLKVQGAVIAKPVDFYPTEQVPDTAAALSVVGAWLREHVQIELLAVGHRVVHGGPKYHRPVLIDGTVLRELEQYVPLAPLHQAFNLAPIRGFLARFPHLPQVACFDTAFHRGHAALVDHYAIPQRFYNEGVRRYGFHGLSYEYVAERIRVVAPTVASGRVIVAHLGSGASMCALLNGKSIETTLGFTALDGLPMGTRPGQLDPGVVLYLLQQKGMSGEEIQHLLYHECGLKGLSGISNDVRELEASSDPRARFALDYFTRKVGLYAGMLAAALAGLDAFVFTAGIGEHSASVRAQVTKELAWLGAALDPVANATHTSIISANGSRIPIYVIPTNEELMIARHTQSLLAASGIG